MHARIASLVLGVAVLTLAGGACSSSKGSDRTDPVVPVPTAPAETTTTAAPDPFAIPEVIDEAYVNRVLAALNEVRGKAVRRIVSKGTVDFESVEHIRAIYNDPEYDVALKGLIDLRQRGLSAFKTPPGNRISEVRQIIQTGSECILVHTTLDFSQVVRDAQPSPSGEVQSVTLRPTQTGADPKKLNPTHWSISYEEVLQGGEIDTRSGCGD